MDIKQQSTAIIHVTWPHCQDGRIPWDIVVEESEVTDLSLAC